MPVTWSVRDGVLIVAAVGDYPSSELTGALQSAMQDPQLGPRTPVLLDARSSVTYLSPDEIHRRIAWLGSLHHDGLFPFIAFVAAADRYRARIVGLGVAALRQLGIEVKVFTEWDAGFAWLREASKPPPSPIRDG
jgi:hypothetical protein